MPEVKLGPDGGYASVFCHYCGWASQSRDMERAIKANDRHERRHAEYVEPPTMEQVMADIDAEHAAHDCHPGPCVCKCGCSLPVNCSVMFGPMCSTCMIRDQRGDPEHGELALTAPQEPDR